MDDIPAAAEEASGCATERRGSVRRACRSVASASVRCAALCSALAVRVAGRRSMGMRRKAMRVATKEAAAQQRKSEGNATTGGGEAEEGRTAARHNTGPASH